MVKLLAKEEKTRGEDRLPLKAPLVVGYKGEIGSFILSSLLRAMPKATKTMCIDLYETEKEKTSRIKKSDVIFLCVPIQHTKSWLKKYKHLLKDKIIAEQTSLKSVIYADKEIENMKLDFLSMHLLFRPSSTPDFKERNLAFLHSSYMNHMELSNFISNITNCSGIIEYADFAMHDYRMGKEQALVHRTILALDKVLDGQGNTFMASQVMKLARRIKQGDKVLYGIIQKNVYLTKIMKDFNKKMKDGIEQ